MAGGVHVRRERVVEQPEPGGEGLDDRGRVVDAAQLGCTDVLRRPTSQKSGAI